MYQRLTLYHRLTIECTNVSEANILDYTETRQQFWIFQCSNDASTVSVIACNGILVIFLGLTYLYPKKNTGPLTIPLSSLRSSNLVGTYNNWSFTVADDRPNMYTYGASTSFWTLVSFTCDIIKNVFIFLATVAIYPTFHNTVNLLIIPSSKLNISQ